MYDTEGPGAGVDRSAHVDALREIAARVSRRRMFSDLSDSERDALVETAVEAYVFAWGPPGLPDDVEAWLGVGMHHAMMEAFRETRMLRRPVRPGATTSLDSVLEEWLSSDGATSACLDACLDAGLVDRFLRQLGPADARLLWMRCEGYTREEIADLLGIRASAVSVRLRRLQIRLREAVEPVTDTTPTSEARQDPDHGVA